MINVVLIAAAVSLILPIVRLAKGPCEFDRVLSLDAINIIITGIIALLALYYENKLFMDIAVVYAVLSFLETITFAKYLEGKNE